jgi:nucleotide-binding universal stress UspA family protein
MHGPVICGIDGSSSDGAVAVARELAGRYELTIHYVHVIDDAGGSSESEKPVRTEHLELEYGDPADRLVAIAAERDASFLVVGSRGERSSAGRSVSAEVSRRASCPVVVVPPGVGVAATRAAAEIVRLASGNSWRPLP